jgi:predicted Rossmann fold flavoprotein
LALLFAVSVLRKGINLKVIVIGAGAAGLMAAYHAAKNGNEVIILEKNEKSGKKIYITGKGRCNLTNTADITDIGKNILRGSKFMYSSLRSFTNEDVIAFFEDRGMHVKEERGGRAFPVSDKASDVIKALDSALKSLGVQIKYYSNVTAVNTLDGHFKSVTVNGKTEIEGDSVIITTGGLSYPSTGSTGDGYSFAKSLGHTVNATRPSLVPFETKESFVRDLSGLSLKNVSISLYKNNKKIYEEFGEMLFTHFGVSGPVILSASADVGDEVKDGNVTLFIDFKPAMSREELDARLLRDFEENKNKEFKNSLDKLLPRSIIPVMVELSKIDPEKKVCEIKKEERKKLLNLLKAFPLNITGLRGYNEAIITKGGINVKEIDPKTMESKKCKGVYFAGEVLDVDAYTGGFNLQIAWSTGAAAGRAQG